MTPIAEKYIRYAFPEAIKKSDKYNMKCPVCGDSKKSKSKKRFWFFEKENNDFVHCFNCGYSASFYRFFRENAPSFFDSYRNELKQKSFKFLSGESLDDMVFDPIPEPEKTEEETFTNPFKEIDEDAKQYLMKRNVYDEILRRNVQVFQATDIEAFGIKFDNYIIFPLLKEDGKTWFGFQGRSLKNKKFFTKIFDEEYPKVWNVFQTDETKPVFVCESIFDALSTGNENSIAVLGVTSNILKKVERDYVICLDNFNFDMAAKKSYRSFVNYGYKAFIWPKNIMFKDFNEMITKGNFKPNKVKVLIEENIEEGLAAQILLRL